MKSWEDAPGPKVPVPLWWLEYHAEHIRASNEMMLREAAREIRRQLELFQKKQQWLRRE